MDKGLLVKCWLLTICISSTFGEYNFQRLEVKGASYQISNPGYPAPASAPFDNEYSLRANDPDAKIKVDCTTFNLGEPAPCNTDYMEIVDGDNTEKICGNLGTYHLQSAGSKVVIKLRSSKAVNAMVRCDVKAVPNPLESFLEFVDMELDSSEAGVKPASKMTTCPCGTSNPSRIVGGKETKANQYPFVVGIANMDTMFLFCGASIITKKHALTAAHCTFTRTDKNKLVVIAGFHDLVLASVKRGRQGEVHRIDRVIEHKGYDPKTMHHDIALLVLKEEMQFSTNVQPVCMPTEHIDIVGQFIRVLGWGKIGTGMAMSDVLRTVSLKVLPIEVCAHKFANVPTSNPTQICTYAHGKDSCQGDSGGPLVWVDPETNRYTLVALVSYGKKECAGDDPGLNTEVAAYLTWIQDNIRATSTGALTCTKA